MARQFFIRILVLVYSIFLSFHSIGQVHSADSSANARVEPKAVLVDVSIMTPPEGFEVSDKFNGFISPKMGTAILLSQINGVSFVILKQAMTDTFFVQNNLTKLEVSNLITESGLKGVIYKCSFHTQNTDFIRYIVYAGDLTRTLWINATYPKIVEELMEPALMKSFKTLHFVKLPKN